MTPERAGATGLAPTPRLHRALLALAALTGSLVLTAVLLEGGAVATLGDSAAAQTLHEVFHDARHLLGVPCH